MPKLVQTREFQQNVQAADKRPRPASLFGNHSCRRWTLPLLLLPSTINSPSPRDKPLGTSCTYLNNRFSYPFGNIVAHHLHLPALGYALPRERPVLAGRNFSPPPPASGGPSRETPSFCFELFLSYIQKDNSQNGKQSTRRCIPTP